MNPLHDLTLFAIARAMDGKSWELQGVEAEAGLPGRQGSSPPDWVVLCLAMSSRRITLFESLRLAQYLPHKETET